MTDVGMVQRRQHLGRAFEARLGENVGPPSGLVSAESGVAGALHHAHAALAEEGIEAVVAEGLADHFRARSINTISALS